MNNQIDLTPTIRIIDGKPIYFYNLQQIERIRDMQPIISHRSRTSANPFTAVSGCGGKSAHKHIAYGC